MIFKKHCAICLFFILFSLSFSQRNNVFSQTGETFLQDGEDKITENKNDKEIKGKKKSTDARIDEIVITATKTNTLADNLPVTAYSVDRNDIDSQVDYGRNNYGELIRNVPGVHVGQSVITAPPWINMRGTGYFVGRTLYLVDGLPVTSSTTPMLTTAINNNDIERIDVLLGTSSALYGPNAAGGVINIITRQGKEGMGAGVSMGYGSNNTIRSNVSAGGEVDGFNYYASYSSDSSDGYRMQPVDGMIDLYNAGKRAYLSTASIDKNKYDNSYMATKFGWEDGRGTGFYAAYNYESLDISGGQDNSKLIDKGKQGLGSVKAYTILGSFVRITANAGHQFWDRPSKSNRGLSINTTGDLVLDTTKTYANESKLERMVGDLQSDFLLNKAGILTLGGSYSTEKLESESRRWDTGVPVSDSETNTDQMAVYAQHQLFLVDNRLSFLAGVRYDRWKYHDIYDSSSNPKNPEGLSKDTVTYRGGVKFKINEYFAVRSSGGTGFWPGTASWLFQNTNTGTTWREANPGLKPERSWMVDSGLEGTFNSTGTSFNLTPYYGKITDMILYRYDQHPSIVNTTIVRTRNASEAEIYGLETLISQKIGNFVSLFVSHTQNHARIIKDSTPTTGTNVNVKGNQISNSPDYYGSAGIKFEDPSLFNASVTLRYSGQRYYNNENTDLPYFEMKPYQTTDVKLWREWIVFESIKLTAAASVNNVFNDDYESEFYVVNPGRIWSCTAGVRYIF